MTFYTCLTTAEWRNLCSAGRIRLLEARAVEVKSVPNEADYAALFSLAADRFSLGETSDILIVEHLPLSHEIQGVSPSGILNGVRWLALTDVIRFFPVREDDRWAFDSDAQKAQVALSEALLESHWQQWFKTQSIDQALMSGLNLAMALGLPVGPDDVEQSRGLVSSLLSGEVSACGAADFAASFFKFQDKLFDLVRDDADFSAVFVSCPIEWANFQSGSDVIVADLDFSELAYRLHEKYSNIPFSCLVVGDLEFVDFHKRLIAMSPNSFPDEWSPLFISVYIRQSHRIRYGSVAPDDIISSVRIIEEIDGAKAASLLSIILGVTLGPNKVLSIERSLHGENFAIRAAASPVQLVDVSLSPMRPEKLEQVSSLPVPQE